jgi:hypothetical protein
VALSVRSIILEQALDVVERELPAQRFAEAATQFLEEAPGPLGVAQHAFRPNVPSLLFVVLALVTSPIEIRQALLSRNLAASDDTRLQVGNYVVNLLECQVAGSRLQVVRSGPQRPPVTAPHDVCALVE